MAANNLFLTLLTVSTIIFAATAPSSADPDLLQDVCVADLNSAIKVNGFVCKANITAEDFVFSGLKAPGNTTNRLGSKVTLANVESFPGVNTLGVSLARIDFAAGGINPPHTHPRATEIIFLLEGTLEVGFITTANKLFTATITAGQVFVFPRGLIHFQKNIGYGTATAIAGFNSQLGGTQAVAATLFTSVPPVDPTVLAKAFAITPEEVAAIKQKLG